MLTVTWCSLFFLCGCDGACLLLGRTADLKGGGGVLSVSSHFSGHWLFCECPKLGRADTVLLLCVPSRRSRLFFFPPQRNPSCTLCRSLVRFLCPIPSLSLSLHFFISALLAQSASLATPLVSLASLAEHTPGDFLTPDIIHRTWHRSRRVCQPSLLNKLSAACALHTFVHSIHK